MIALAENPAPSQMSVLDQIGKLHELKKDGAITQEEYDIEKAKLLGSY